MAPQRKVVHVVQNEAPQFREVTWWRDRGLIRLYACCAVVCLASATTGYDGSMLNGLQLLPGWQNYFHRPDGSRLGLVGSIYSIGSLAGLPFAPYIADRFGRKRAIWTGCAILFAGVSLQSASTNYDMFVIARFFIGFGCTLAQLSSPLLLTEIAHPQHRGKVTAVYNCLWNLGAIVATWLAFGTSHIRDQWEWRIPSILQAFPSVFQFCLLFFVPESPRWLISRDRAPEALRILADYHANGDEHDPTVMFEYAEIKETIRLEYLIKKQTSYLDFLRTKGNRHRLFLLGTLGLFSQWSGNGLASYYFSHVMKSIGVNDTDVEFYVNGSLVVVALVVSVSCAFLVDRAGRRPLFLTATTGMLIMFTLWTVCTALYETSTPKNMAAGKAVIAFIFLYSISYALAWSGLLVAYTVEILPFKLRAKGLMVMNFFVQGALVFNQYINPVGLAHLKPTWKYETIYCCWIAFELLIVFLFYVETRGPTLEEIAKIFDREEVEYGVADVGEVRKDISSYDSYNSDMELGKYGYRASVEPLEKKRSSWGWRSSGIKSPRSPPVTSPRTRTVMSPGWRSPSVKSPEPVERKRRSPSSPPNFSRVERRAPPRPDRMDRDGSTVSRATRGPSPTDFTRLDQDRRDRGSMF